MKIGFRTPSLKKSLKARTTGRLKRSIKRTANPLYGKKGMGLLKPKKALYNKVYNKTTIDPLSPIKSPRSGGKSVVGYLLVGIWVDIAKSIRKSAKK